MVIPMSDFVTTRAVRGRKQHCCELCGLRIRRGAKHVVASGVWDGRPVRCRYHAVCLSKTAGWDAMDWESSAGQYAEFRKYDLGLPLLDAGAVSIPDCPG